MKERHCHMINLESITSSISKYSFLRKQQNQAILDATGTNPVNLHGERKIQGDNEVGNARNKQIEKIKPWLSKAQRNVTYSANIIKELNRIQVLDSTKENYTVERASLVTPEQVREFEEMMQIKYRFINQRFPFK